MKYLMTLTLCLSIANASQELTKAEILKAAEEAALQLKYQEFINAGEEAAGKFQEGETVEFRLTEKGVDLGWVEATVTDPFGGTYCVEIEPSALPCKFYNIRTTRYGVKEEDLRESKREERENTAEGKFVIKMFEALEKDPGCKKANKMITECTKRLNVVESLVREAKYKFHDTEPGIMRRLNQNINENNMIEPKDEARKLLGKVLDPNTQTFKKNNEFVKFLKRQIISYVKVGTLDVNKGQVQDGVSLEKRASGLDKTLVFTVIDRCVLEVVELYKKAGQLEIFEGIHEEDMDAIVESAIFKLVQPSKWTKWTWLWTRREKSPEEARYKELKKFLQNTFSQIKA